MNIETSMDQFVKIMKALADPSRLKIIKMLQHKPLCVCEIQKALDIPQPTASRQLKILEDTGLAVGRKSGLWVNYNLADGSDSPYSAMLLGGLRHWLEDDPEIVRMVNKLPAIKYSGRREDICKE
jgi:ArsR family transcriptional regulator, arsenate/arsenite/antimonite-responsive transcriptional repressor